ncbi:Yip1 family protein [Primorskyibacter sp. S87]|uniref:Yip1 family protein n=1 Tax=Primorskyibacter sp. S87 TaxID=3415126 RepID=UPI003C7D32D5
MTPQDLVPLAVTTITRPQDAAKQVLALNLPRNVLWLALFLAVVLNCFLFMLSNLLVPAPADMPVQVTSPTIYGAIVGGGLVLTITSLTFVGRAMGGQGSFNDVMALMVWMQLLRVALQAVALVLMLTVPILSMLLVLAAALVGLYIMVHFINEAHRLNSLGRAVFVLLGAVFAIALAMMVLLSLMGGAIGGGMPHV